MKMQFQQHPTSNIQHPTSVGVGAWKHWLFDVGCWMLDVSKQRAAVLFLLFSATFAFAQSNGVPTPTDYAKFSSFVTDRNIFDPSRQPHSYTPGYRPRVRTRTRTETPGIVLVGTMSYEKGWFAFFNGNSDELKKALRVGEKIADYTVAGILPGSVRLESADKKAQLDLKVGDGLRQENGKWVFAGAGEVTATAGTSHPIGSATEEKSEPAAPPSGTEQNDVLKRLMQLREKENQ
jgi:hypothetical protein